MSEGGQSPNRRSTLKRSPTYNSNNGGSGGNNFDLDDVNSAVFIRKNFEAGEKLLFEQFEGVAANVTKLYHTPSWPVFQKAAASVTQFYKDSVESYRRGYESGVGLGRQLLCKELLASLQLSAHPYIRRDDCIDLILARTSSGGAAIHGSPHSAIASSPTNCSVRMSPPNSNSLVTMATAEATQTDQQQQAAEDDLAIFQEALNSRPQALTAFYVEERRRHAKRRRDESDDDPSCGGGGWTMRKRNRRNF